MASSGSGGPPQSKDQVHYELIKTLNSGSEEQKKAIQDKVDFICAGFPHSEDYESGDENKSSYKLCCETADYCSFYHQLWFFTLCAVVICLISITFMIVTVICVIKRRNKPLPVRKEIITEEEFEEMGGGAKPMKTGKTSTGKEGNKTTGGLLSSGNSYL